MPHQPLANYLDELPKGFRYAGVRCGLKNRKNDLGLIVCDQTYPAAGVFTQNQFFASSVEFTRYVLESGQLDAIVVNSGNANCATGEQGARDTLRMAALVSETVANIPNPAKIAVSSTGIIGQPLDMQKVEVGIRAAANELDGDPRPFLDSILTTDLVEKWTLTTFGDLTAIANPKSRTELQPGPKFFGVCKGSGMIAPNMATMLGYIVTDLDVSQLDLSAQLKEAVSKSFNSLTVDGDTSTNDMVLLVASGKSGVQPSATEFQTHLDAVCIDLAKQIARDGEGATKLVQVTVRHHENPKKIAKTIAESPLVKTAMFGCDPNWGRIIAAAGRAGVPINLEKATLKIEAAGESFVLYQAASPVKFDPERVSQALKNEEVTIDLDFGGSLVSTIFTCDFGYGYVRINAEYHT